MAFRRVTLLLMRRIVGLLPFFLLASAQADRLITVPTARKISYGTVRYEFRREPTSDGQRENLLGIGVSPSFDLELRTFQDRGGNAEGTFDFSYNYIAAIPGFSPGISFGVQDVADKTLDGRRFFLAFTSRQPLSTLNGDYPADITLGVMGERSWTPYVGVSIPFSKEFHALAEHNGNRVSAGFEYRPFEWVNFRAQAMGNRMVLGVQLTTHF